jgi:hypothetical protein
MPFMPKMEIHAGDGDHQDPGRPSTLALAHVPTLFFFSVRALFSSTCMQSVQLGNKGVAGPRWRRLTEQAMPRHRISHALNAYSACFAACARWMANLACCGAHHTASLIAQTDTRKRVRGMHAVSQRTAKHPRAHTHHGLCTRLHNTAHTPFSPPLPCTSLQPNNHRRISDAELKPFKTRRLSVSCDARTEHIGRGSLHAPCHLGSS